MLHTNTADVDRQSLSLPEPDTSLPAIKKVQHWHTIAQQHGRAAVEAARNCGDLLAQEQQRLKSEGMGWIEWCRAHLPFSYETARRYMRIAEHWDLSRVTDAASIRGAIEILAEPEPIDQPASDLGIQAARTTIFTRKRYEGTRLIRDMVVVEPSSQPRCFYLTHIESPESEYAGAIVEGTRRPILEDGIEEFLSVMSINARLAVESGGREDHASEPHGFNRWLYDDYEHYLDEIFRCGKSPQVRGQQHGGASNG
jgi:hypothetical protein